MLAELKHALVALLFLPLSCMAAQVIIVNADPPGQGFNDPTPAKPVGGNPGTTVGQQTLNVFQRAADTWGSKLQSTQPVFVLAFFTPLPCDDTFGVIGAAEPLWYLANFPGVSGGKPLATDTWYTAAHAEKITHQSVVPGLPDPWHIFAVFNSDFGKPGCLTGFHWYYGLDHNEPLNGYDLLAIVMHELGHGLGFTVSPTSTDTGERFFGMPSVWERFVLDTSTGKRWIEMSDTERAASARNNWNLVWAGQYGSNVIPSVLDFRTEVTVENSPLGVNEAQPANFGPSLKNKSVGGVLAAPDDGGGVSLRDGCEPFAPGALAGRIALIDRGNCLFTQKVKNAQNAGALAAIVANDQPEGLPPMGGADSTVTIPSVGITNSFGTALRAALPSVFVDLATSPTVRVGTTAGYPRLYASSNFASISNVSHWDVSLTPNMLMEPFYTRSLTSALKNPDDLTLNLFYDIGW